MPFKCLFVFCFFYNFTFKVFNLKYLNTQSYLFWNEHEPMPGVYDFDGQNDVFSFMELAQKMNFVVILRPGPYICGEHDYGLF